MLPIRLMPFLFMMLGFSKIPATRIFDFNSELSDSTPLMTALQRAGMIAPCSFMDSAASIVYDMRRQETAVPFIREFVPSARTSFSFIFGLEPGWIPAHEPGRKPRDLTLLIAMNDFHGRKPGNTNFLVSVLKPETGGWRFSWGLGNPETNRPVGTFTGPLVVPGKAFPVEFRFLRDSSGTLLSVECLFNGRSLGNRGFHPDRLPLPALTIELGPLRSGYPGKQGRLYFSAITCSNDSPDTAVPGPRVHGIVFAEPDEERPVWRLARGRWYDLRLKLSSPGGPDSLGFVLTWMNSPAYTEGVFETKGGRFSGRDNYIFNFSFNPLLAYEKQTPLRFNTTRLSGGTGLYTDSRPETFRFNPEESLLVCRVRLLPEADTGLWTVRSCLESVNLSRSPILQTSLRVGDSAPSGRGIPPSLLPLAAVLCGAGLVLVLLRRRRTAIRAPAVPRHPDPRFLRLKNHVLSHLNEELNIAEIEKEFGLSYYALNKGVKAQTGQSLKNWVITLRIDRARELLRTTDKSVMDIMFETGFNNPAHFSTIFRKYTGKSPSEFRERS